MEILPKHINQIEKLIGRTQQQNEDDRKKEIIVNLMQD